MCPCAVVSLLDILLEITVRSNVALRDLPTLAPLKVLFDWLRSDPELISEQDFTKPRYSNTIVNSEYLTARALSLQKHWLNTFY